MTVALTAAPYWQWLIPVATALLSAAVFRLALIKSRLLARATDQTRRKVTRRSNRRLLIFSLAVDVVHALTALYCRWRCLDARACSCDTICTHATVNASITMLNMTSTRPSPVNAQPSLARPSAATPNTPLPTAQTSVATAQTRK
jgi:hypothetical protein